MNKEDIQIFISEQESIKIIQPSDVNTLYLETLTDFDSMVYMGNTHGIIMTHKKLCEYIDLDYHNKNSYLFGLFDNGKLIATSRVHDIKFQEAWQGVLVFKSERGKKKGQLLVNEVSNFCLEHLDILRIKAGILNVNLISQKLFSQCNFLYINDDESYHNKELTRQIWLKNNA